LKEAMFYEKKDDRKVRCTLCPHRCYIPDGGKGLCHVRANIKGKLYAESYGELTSVSLDPVEKKPFYRYFPGKMILSVGSYGCNFRCSFCQNYAISQADKTSVATVYTKPEELVAQALDLIPSGNIGIAYTYNEPLIGFEYVLDCAKLARLKDLKNVLVTNGFINEAPLARLLPYIDAMNIDLKSFSPYFYKRVGGELEAVKRTIATAAGSCHVEVTTLIIPGENDSTDEIDELSAWLASIDRELPLHITRFFPRYRMMDKQPTPVDAVYELAEIARKNLKYVFEGNV